MFVWCFCPFLFFLTTCHNKSKKMYNWLNVAVIPLGISATEITHLVLGCVSCPQELSSPAWPLTEWPMSHQAPGLICCVCCPSLSSQAKNMAVIVGLTQEINPNGHLQTVICDWFVPCWYDDQWSALKAICCAVIASGQLWEQYGSHALTVCLIFNKRIDFWPGR